MSPINRQGVSDLESNLALEGRRAGAGRLCESPISAIAARPCQRNRVDTSSDAGNVTCLAASICLDCRDSHPAQFAADVEALQLVPVAQGFSCHCGHRLDGRDALSAAAFRLSLRG